MRLYRFTLRLALAATLLAIMPLAAVAEDTANEPSAGSSQEAASLPASTAEASNAGERVDPYDAFYRIKELEGTWKGEPNPVSGRVARVDYRLTAAGHTVLATMMPGSQDEMINMFFMEGDDLYLTHYCSGGNQPQMIFDPEASTADHYHFKFSGGNNVGGEDAYIEAADLHFVADGLKEDWHSTCGSTITLTMKRGEADEPVESSGELSFLE